MDRRGWRGKGVLLGVGIALALFGGLNLERAAAGSPPSEGPGALVEANVVLSGSYSCSYTVTTYLVGPIGDPDPIYETYAETADTLSMDTTGGKVPVKSPPAFGIRPGGRPPTATPVSGFGTGHSFNDGSIEDCVRFGQAISATARSLGCTASDLRRRQPPLTPGINSGSVSLNFVCEGPQAEIVHGMGELSRAVLGLKLQSAP